MDEVDGDFRTRKQKPMNSFQRELDAKMKERRAKGLTADITSEESEEDSILSNNDLLMQYSTSRQNRPRSAKHRSGHASSMQGNFDMTLDEEYFRAVNDMRGHQLSDNDDIDDNEIMHKQNKKSGVQQKENRFVKKPQSREILKASETSIEDSLFGWKSSIPRERSPTSGFTGPSKPWQPPSFQNVSPSDNHRKELLPESGLDSTLKSQTPRTPRFERNRKESKSPRDLSLEDSEKPTPTTRRKNDSRDSQNSRTTPALDIFGKSRSEQSAEIEKELEDIEEKKKEADKRQWRADDRKTPTQQKSPDFRRLTPRQKTPTDLKGKQTPTNRKSPTDANVGELQSKKEPSLLDFMIGDTASKPTKDTPKPKERPKRILKDGRIPSESQDSRQIGDGVEMPRQVEDTSSLCEEVKDDPAAMTKKSVDESGEGKMVTETKTADDIISLIAKAQKGMQFIEPAKRIRPVSAHAKVEHRPKPRYGVLPGETVSLATERQFNSTTDIRNAVYEEWYRQHMKEAKRMQKEKEKKEKEENEKKKKEKEDKEMEAKLSYKAWQEKKKELIAEQEAKKQEEAEKKREMEEKEKEEQRKNSEVTFSKWKEKKDEFLKFQHRQNQLKQRKEKQAEEAKKKDKEKDGTSAFKKWKASKDTELKSKLKASKKAEEQEKINLDATRRMKEDEASVKYEEWLKTKEKHELRKKIELRSRRMSGDVDERPPWSPANYTVPFGR
ncbi:microtubule-associated protein 9-like isoform X3 [Pomacea canaliculata]|uniref:microtubule-associated protein 9-like isoform X3 n=1 Tax=Pomacea canaliculata TaxID=400727 RepID=UPI000D732036|nr:microtubule-associated protein 9-like isoform X3 [Pomacea canaliculata]